MGHALHGARRCHRSPLTVSGGATSPGYRLCRCLHRRQPRVAPDPGKMQCRMLGAAVEAWDAGAARCSMPWESWCTQPIPSMPSLWNDPGGERATWPAISTCTRRASGRKPGAVTVRRRWAQSGAMATGSRLARRKMAAASFWPFRRHHQPPRPAHGHQRALQRRRSPARSARQPGGRSRIPGPRELHALFVVLRPGRRWTMRCAHASTAPSARRSSPRFVPDDIFAVAEVPCTLSGRSERRSRNCCWAQPIGKVVTKGRHG